MCLDTGTGLGCPPYPHQLNDPEDEDRDGLRNVGIYKKRNHITRPIARKNFITSVESYSPGKLQTVTIDAIFYSDGAKACGYFVALAFLVEKIKLEQECDVCQAVRMVRQNREQFVPTFVSIIKGISEYTIKLQYSEIQRILIPLPYFTLGELSA
jgi:hypothetical protein